MKYKLVLFINILFIILVLGLAILQYFWLEKVRQTEFYRMKRSLSNNAAKIISDINTDFFYLYQSIQTVPGILNQEINEKQKNEIQSRLQKEGHDALIESIDCFTLLD